SSSGSMIQRVGPSVRLWTATGSFEWTSELHASQSPATPARRGRAEALSRYPGCRWDMGARLCSSVHAALSAHRLGRLLDRTEGLLVALQVRREGADDALQVPGAGDQPRRHDALRRHQVDEVEDELLARMGDAQQVGVAALELFVADLDV